MEKAREKGISGSDIKYLAILAMLLDHVAMLFMVPGTAPYIILRMVGRVTAPIMCFFISEGYHYTRDLKKYFLRLGIFAVISHFIYAFCFRGSFLSLGQSSMITTLLLCLLSVHIISSKRFKLWMKLPVILLICWAADLSDWGREAVIYTTVFELARPDRRDQIKAFAIAAIACKVLILAQRVVGDYTSVLLFLPNLGVLLVIPLLMAYNGTKGGGRYTKWVFYVFYPAHLLILGFISWRYG